MAAECSPTSKLAPPGTAHSAVRLETNRVLDEAIGLYRSAGYREVVAFSDEPYAHHWFEKSLDQPELAVAEARHVTAGSAVFPETEGEQRRA